MIQFQVFSDSSKGIQVAAQMMYEYIISQPQGILGLATGNTFIGIYESVLQLLNHHHDLDLSKLVTCNLDDYIVNGYSIKESDLRSFKYYMKKHFFDSLKKFGFNDDLALFPADVYPRGKKFAWREYLREFDQTVADKGGIDIQFVGIGSKESPHVAFCEPNFTIYRNDYNWLEHPSYITEVNEITRIANRFNLGCNGDSERVPKMAATMSTGSLYRLVQNTYVLVAFGENKSIVKPCFETASEKNPASIIQVLDQKGINCHVICDVAAAKGIENYL